MPTQTFLLGMNAKIYRGAEGAVLADLTEMGNVKDVTVTMEAGEADVTTRANSGWRATAPTLRECTVEFEMLWKPSDEAFAAIYAAFLTGGLVRLAPLTGAKSADGVAQVAGSDGIWGDFAITNCTRNEPLEEGVTASVTAKLSVFAGLIENGLEAA